MYRRTPWPKLWEEFVSEPNQHGRIKYLNIEQFIKDKAQGSQEEALLHAMIGTAVDEGLETEARKWGLGEIGNWEARRQRLWTASVMMREFLCELRKCEVHAMLNNLQIAIQRAIDRAGRLESATDLAYTGQPYLPHLPPTAARNRARVRAYIRDTARAFQVLREGMDAWRTIALIEAVANGQIAWNGSLADLRGDALIFTRDLGHQQRR